MYLQKIFKAGNSSVVAIPQDLLREKKLKPGQQILVEAAPFGDAIVIRKKTEQATANNSVVSKEFQKWLRDVLAEDKEILDELAVR